jgi:crotonobetainyl-CoA:carnitine CoA-transferase CaiB-like acyl-CoA transferase
VTANGGSSLAGVTVVDFTHLVAGPFCTMLLADQGATVVKVERLDGEIARARWPRISSADGSCSAYFAALNRGKQSVAVDLSNPDGRTIVRRLIDRSDVVVENFRDGVLERLLGASAEELRRERPALIVASVSLFGRDPERAEPGRPGVAVVAESEAGISANARDREGRPVWSGFALGDFAAGMAAYAGITTALVRAVRTGVGSYLDVSMFESMLAFNAISLVREQCDERSPNTSPDGMGAGYGVVPTKDGHVAVGVNSNAFWRALCHAMGMEELAADERFRTEHARTARKRELMSIIEGWAAALPTAEVCRRFARAGVPYGEVRGSAEILASDRARDLAALTNATWNDVAVRVPRSPLRFSGESHSHSGSVIPRVGSDTRQVLSGILDLGDIEIQDLAERGVVGV